MTWIGHDKGRTPERCASYTVDANTKIAPDVVDATRETARNYLVLFNKELRTQIEATVLGRRRELMGEPTMS